MALVDVALSAIEEYALYIVTEQVSAKIATQHKE